ncbi:MAG: 50S ribosomal protein L9 [PS1 clade bacterium]|uniref:Large ribosomal subunit protein bL9 n=1 Tax=PS1 clade bacterium TaxID=2175152 RepID=A0A368DR29_9PROT|nr:MAG: 50S ribosomal protein L9 [PS1 clade bacterium]|tara:strand:+ start:647 stop:1294 length:648 start_codon:yes stop_codon:yes gene_type:complete
MKIILLEKIEKLGQLGDVVNVKNGYARNFLLPKAKALRATDDNLKYFESKSVEIRKKNDKEMASAAKLSESINNKTFIVIRQAGENGQLFGSVTTRDIANMLSDDGVPEITRNQVSLVEPIKALGIVDVRIDLHPEVSVIIKLNIARTSEEADMQEKGPLNNLDKENTEIDSVVDVFEEGVEINIDDSQDVDLNTEHTPDVDADITEDEANKKEE